MLWEVIGPALFAGLAVILFNVPLTYFNTMLMGKASNRLMHSRDRRVAAVNETLSAIKLVKSNAWQSSFKERITRSREEELGPLFKFQVVMMMFGIQVILPPAPGVSNEGGISPLLGPLPAVFRPWVPAWGSLEPLVETVKTRKK